MLRPIRKTGFIVKKYDEIRERLIQMLADLEQRLDKITNDVKHSEEPLAKDFEEQALQTENDQVLDFLGNAARKEIAMLKQAIARIDSGNYGICRVCDEPIGDERLKAVPYTDLCIKCAGRAEEIKG